MNSKENKAILDFEEHCRKIQEATPVDINDNDQTREARIKRAKKDYNYLFTYYFPHYATDLRTGIITPCSKFQVKAANKLLKSRVIRMLLNWFRGAAKTTHSIIGFPIYLWINKELNCALFIGENEDKAKEHLSALQAEFQHNHRLKRDFGDQYNYGDWSKGRFNLRDGTAFFSLGLGQSPRGIKKRQLRPDYIGADDLDTKKRCKNPTLVKEAGEWLLEDLMGCFGTFAERFVFSNNRISKTSIVEWVKDKLKNTKSFIYSRVVATDGNGNPNWPERDTKEYWDEKKANTPNRSYEREYNDNPVEDGNIFLDEYLKYKKIPKLSRFDHLVCYADPSWKDKKKNDFKAVRTWGRIGTHLYLINSFVRQTSIKSMVENMYDVNESIPEDVICYYYMEASFMQDTLLDEFETEGEIRGYQLPIRGDYRAKPDKFQRIEAMEPLYNRGFVFWNADKKDDKDFETGKDQLLAFEKGSSYPDDAPDADEGAIWYLQKSGRQPGKWKDSKLGFTKKRVW